MAKHRHLTKLSGRSTRGKTLPPPRRIDVAKLPPKNRRFLATYTCLITELIEQEEQNQLSETALKTISGRYRQSVAEIRKSMKQLRRYKMAYPHENPANAFAPLPRDFRLQTTRTETSSRQDPPIPQLQPGLDLALIPDEAERDRIQAFAEDIFRLRRLQDREGRLPKGLLEEVAKTHNYSKIFIRKSIERQRQYCQIYPDHIFVRAHTPKPIGRPNGRAASPEVIETIQQARINRKWSSLNADGGADEIDQPIDRKLIHSLVKEIYGEVHCERTTRRIIEDYEREQAGRVAVADEGDASLLQSHLPAIANRAKTRGPGERCQFDVRPLPVIVDNGGVESSVHVMLVMDDATERITSWELVFTKYVDDAGETQTKNFNGQLCRATIARSIIEINGRYREFYADNGFQELKRYLPFLTSPGEDPTKIIYRRPYRPRGGGGIEVAQQAIDYFLKTRQYYVRERDFRRSRKKVSANLTSAEAMRKDFAEYVRRWNNDPGPNGEPSRIERWNSGPNFLLTAPTMNNLAMFALTQKCDTREPRQDPDCWFTYDGVSYVAAQPDPALYERFANLSIRRSRLKAKKNQEALIKLRIFDLGGEPLLRLVLFSLDDEQTWDLAIPANTSELFWKKHMEMSKQVEHRLMRKNDDVTSQLLDIVLRSGTRSLVIDGFGRERKFVAYQPEEAAQSIATTEEEERLQTEDYISAQETAVDLISSASARSTDPNAKQGRTRKARRQKAQAPKQASPTPVGDTDEEWDDIPDFMSGRVLGE